MGIVHRATVSPSKQELVATWLPTQPWAEGLVVAEKVAEYRFDDPAGEVGVETILWRTTDGALLQVPLTYRAAPLPGAEEHLVTTAHHSVLGERWVYDGCGDPVWAATLVTGRPHRCRAVTDVLRGRRDAHRHPGPGCTSAAAGARPRAPRSTPSTPSSTVAS